MTFDVFSGAVTTLIELTKAIFALKNVPAKEREQQRKLLHETFSLLDGAILLVMQKLHDLLLLADTERDKFVAGLKSLGFQPEWERMARDVRLCQPLRAASSELERLVGSLGPRLSLKDPGAIYTLIGEVLDREGQLASFISRAFQDLASRADDLSDAKADLRPTRELVRKYLHALRHERDALIRAEIQSFDAI